MDKKYNCTVITNYDNYDKIEELIGRGLIPEYDFSGGDDDTQSVGYARRSLKFCEILMSILEFNDIEILSIDISIS